MNQKLDNMLNLALSLPDEQREKTLDLNTGYDPADNRWDVVLRYGTELGEAGVDERYFTILYGGYVVASLTREEIERISQLPTVEFMEMPKQLLFELEDSLDAACITPVYNPPLGLTGEGVITACVDSGVDYSHPAFRNADGTTRILYLWDQQLDEIYSRDDINRALEQSTVAEQRRIVPSTDSSGHGTHVLGIMAGSGGSYRGVAPKSDIIVVKLGSPQGSTPRTSELMRGVDYCIRTSNELGRPVAINLSYGNSYGSHNGFALVETYLDTVSGIGRNVIVVGSGNEGAAARHTSAVLVRGQNRQIEWTIGQASTSINLQIWKDYSDSFDVILRDPSGNETTLSSGRLGIFTEQLGTNVIHWVYGEPAPYNRRQEIYLEVVPSGDSRYIQSGVWNIILRPIQIKDGRVDMWLPSGGRISESTGFLVPVKSNTITIPATARKVISTGAYNSRTGAVATFSGQGSSEDNPQKPDIVAPGVDILSAAPGGTYTRRSGTSMATPFVTGSAALLMEWGIVRGNDSYLYGEKVKAYLIRGARQLEGYENPNPVTGWGALCVRNSLPG